MEMERKIEELQQILSERDRQVAEMSASISNLSTEKEVQRTIAENSLLQLKQERDRYEQLLREKDEHLKTQMEEWKQTYNHQLETVKQNADQQIKVLKEMNLHQVQSQAQMIKEQMKATSEEILKERAQELATKNNEQVSLIIDPLKQSLKEMKEALDKNKEQQSIALNRLDATIQANMQKSAALGETADRITRALTG